jgi:3-oxoadipate enol-lactonase
VSVESVAASPVVAVPLLHYRIDGTGPRVVLLHPVGLDLTCFDPLVGALAREFTVLRVDLRGHGKSAFREAPATLDAYADDVHRLLHHLDWAPAAVIGFSFGGMLAQVLALSHPGDVSALVIAACASTLTAEGRTALALRGETAERLGMAAVVDATLQRWFSQAFRDHGADRVVREQLLAMDPRAWASAWRAISGVNTRPRLAAITAPTLCLAGGDDVSAPPDTVHVIADSINGARFEVLDNAAHMFFIEHPQSVVVILAEFLRQCAKNRTSPADD